ncbi:MAG: sigma-54 dependent transcriptional regulator [bacterium]
MAYRVLIVDDDQLMARSLSRCLESEGLAGFPVPSGEAALARLTREDFDLVLLDLSMPGINGFQTLEGIKADHPDLPVIILSASQDIHDAIEAMKQGADDYLIKSSSMDEAVRLVAKKALKAHNLAKEHALLKRQAQERINQYHLITESTEMKQVYGLIEKIAKKEHSTVLITGESGTGKEVVARTIHNLSPNPDKVFVDISCSALPGSLVESELFGFEKGAFTDAKSAKQGLLELADGGTLFLDEIATLNLSVQAKLLRFLEQRTFRRIGSTVDRKVDIRVIAATNRDLAKKVISAEFREDLFYRLNVFPITIPPLRERRDDIIPLSDFFIQRFNREFHLNIQGLHHETGQLLVQYTYPGNIRELKNIIERAMIIEESDRITPASLHFPKGEMFFAEPISTRPVHLSSGGNQSQGEFQTLADMERDHILKALRHTGGNKEQAAKLLGIGRSTLFRKLAGFDDTKPER